MNESQEPQEPQEQPGRFVGKVAVITGAASGIGRATACQLAREGARVVICGSKNIAGLEETGHIIQSMNGEYLTQQVDVRDQEAVERMVQATLDRYATIDILINNAGAGQFMPFHTMTNEEYDRVMDTNVRGIFHFCRAVLPIMMEKNSGKIVNVTSVVAEAAAPAQSIYGASKAAAKMLTQSIALDIATYNINVNAVAPGLVRTGLTQNVMQDEKRVEFFKSRIPKQRIGEPEDIAPAILFLCSDAATYIHGTTLIVDGGMTCTRA